ADLPAHWARLDAFEGEAYLRQPVDVEMEGGGVKACIYRLLEEEPAPTGE
ncbi:MAG: gamma-glutamylcyclotransferase, partial [Rhodobacteraceae bacterium]|nr:gamma-glutamylcyclotransferase [Paracoccaceae bacterium]